MSIKVIKDSKTIFDSIHGDIQISNLAKLVIDTPEFQRLRNLHQLGTCHYVFPGATHKRFEHSIGTYYLAGKVIAKIKDEIDADDCHTWLCELRELDDYFERSRCKKRYLDDYICELVKIAGLCHDLGHGPFSHVFDDVFIPSVKATGIFKDHETRSGAILERIIETTDLKYIIKKPEIEFIKNMIDPHKVNHFIYQVVSNSLNSIDVDKFDYLTRDANNVGITSRYDFIKVLSGVKVIDNTICYPKQDYINLWELFNTRYILHKKVYSNKAVVSVQYMINDIMLLLNKHLHLSDSINDPDKFITLDEDVILSYLKIAKIKPELLDEDVLNAIEIFERICYRDLYQFVGNVVTKNPIDIDARLISHKFGIDQSNIIINKSKIGFVSGNKKNPLDSIYFYDRKERNKKFLIDQKDVSYLVPQDYQENILMVFLKERIDKETTHKMLKFMQSLEKE